MASAQHRTEPAAPPGGTRAVPSIRRALTRTGPTTSQGVSSDTRRVLTETLVSCLVDRLTRTVGGTPDLFCSPLTAASRLETFPFYLSSGE